MLYNTTRCLACLLVLLAHADALAVDISVLPALGTPAQATDGVLTYDSSAAAGSRASKITLDGSAGTCLTGAGTLVAFPPLTAGLIPLSYLPQGTAGYILTGTGASAPEYSGTLNIGPSAAVPELLFRDTDHASADLTDQDAASIKANQTTVTDDAEISDVFITTFGAAVAGTEYTNFWFDASAASLYLGIMTDSTAPAEVADYEYLRLNFNTATDAQIEVTSSATELSFSTLNLVTTGTISGKLNTVVEATATTWNVTTAQASASTFFINTNAGTKTFVLPAAVAGMSVCVKNGQGVNQVLRVDTDGTDYIVKSTGARTSAAGDYYGATASTSNQICLVALDDTDWYVTSEVGTWTEE